MLRCYDYYPIEGRVLDIGGYIGDTAIYFARRAKEIWVYEPNPYNYRFLLRNILLNHVKNVYPFPFGLGPVKTTAKFYVPRFVPGAGSLIGKEDRNLVITEVQLVPPDQVFDKSFDLVKMDCKGCEIYFFERLNDYADRISYLIIQYGPIHESLMKWAESRLIESGFRIDKKEHAIENDICFS